MAVPVTADRDHAAILTIQFALDHGMDEAAHALAHLRFNQIKPVVEKIHSRIADRLRGLRDVLFMAWSPARRSNVR